MTLIPARFGTDLRLLGDVEHQNQRERGEDLRTHTRAETSRVDLQSVSEVLNLQQALLLRFLTPVGELAAFGHPTYGSRMHELIGELNSRTNRDRAKLFALTALQAEPRVKAVTTIAVTTRRDRPSHITVDARLAVLDEDSDLNFVFPFDFEGGTT